MMFRLTLKFGLHCVLRTDQRRKSWTPFTKTRRPVLCKQKALFTLLNSFDSRGIWPPAVLSLTFAIVKSFFGALCNNSAIIGSS